VRSDGSLLVCESQVPLVRALQVDSQQTPQEVASESIDPRHWVSTSEEWHVEEWQQTTHDEDSEEMELPELNASYEEGNLLERERELLAHEIALLGAEEDPTSPLSADAMRWLDEGGDRFEHLWGAFDPHTTLPGPSPVSTAINRARARTESLDQLEQAHIVRGGGREEMMDEIVQQLEADAAEEASGFPHSLSNITTARSHASTSDRLTERSERSKDSTPRKVWHANAGFSELPNEEEAVDFFARKAEEEAEYYMGNLAEIRFTTCVECLLELNHEQAVKERIQQLHLLVEARRSVALEALRQESDSRRESLLEQSTMEI